MKKKRFSVEQIVGVLKQVEAGVPIGKLVRHVVEDLCGGYGVSERRACIVIWLHLVTGATGTRARSYG